MTDTTPQAASTPDELLTFAEAADVIGVDTACLHTYVTTGALPSVERNGEPLISWSDLADLAERREHAHQTGAAASEAAPSPVETSTPEEAEPRPKRKRAAKAEQLVDDQGRIIGICAALEHEMFLQGDLEAATVADEDARFRDPDNPTICLQCAEDGYVVKANPLRRDIVVENCEFYAAHGVGLSEAAGRERYSDRSHLDSVLRRWGRVDLAHALADADPILPRDRPF